MIKVIRKKNPTDKEFLKNIKIQKVKDKRNSLLTYNAYLNNNYIGGADLDLVTNTVKSVYVKPSYRLKGLSTFIYNRIEKDLGFKLKPSNELYPDEKEFWKSRLKNPTDNHKSSTNAGKLFWKNRNKN